jgi:uncharacterized protein YecE (DUF72 family)
MSELRVGTSGYQYDHWKGEFYPVDLPQKEWFEHYRGHFDTVEINNTFYNLPSAKTFENWHDRAPANFRYALKFSRYGTHMKKLKDPEKSLDSFIERAEKLKSYLGPILVQLPPNWKANPERLDEFLEAAPSRHRWAVEMRNNSWLNEEVYEVLRSHRAALCLHDILEGHPEVITANWVYLRYHGVDYSHNYTPQELEEAAHKIERFLNEGMDVYAYFNNDAHANAVRNAEELRDRLTAGV